MNKEIKDKLQSANLSEDEVVLAYQDVIKDKIKSNVKNIECNICISMWKNPSLIDEYDKQISASSFKYELWRTYYVIAKLMYDNNYQTFDEISVQQFLDNYSKSTNKDFLRKAYETFGGFTIVQRVINAVHEENIEKWVDDCLKYDSLWKYIDEMTITPTVFSSLQQLSYNQSYDFIEAKNNHIFTQQIKNGEIKDIRDGIRGMVEEADKGMNVGMGFNLPTLSKEVCGMRLGQIYAYGALSGAGKTTIVQAIILSSIWENHEDQLIFLNEQDIVLWQQKFITWIINNKLLGDDEPRFSSNRWLYGHFTDHEKELIDKAITMLEERMKPITDENDVPIGNGNRILIYSMQSYSAKEVTKYIKKYAKLGIKYFLLDTLKLSADSNSSDSSWLSLMNDMVNFDNLCKPSNLNVHFDITLQLEKTKGSTSRYLNESMLGISKNIKDTMSGLFLMRRLYNDEYTGEKNEIKVIKPMCGSIHSGSEVTLDKEKTYMILFIDKNRNGGCQQYQIVIEADLGSLIFKEVGITTSIIQGT